ncbi:MAG: hypothetical protein ABIW82_02150 [Dokdonella sp.]
MFRTTDLFHSIAHFVYEEEPIAVPCAASRNAAFESEDIVGTLMPVYSEIARRLSRNAYTSHGVA